MSNQQQSTQSQRTVEQLQKEHDQAVFALGMISYQLEVCNLQMEALKAEEKSRKDLIKTLNFEYDRIQKAQPTIPTPAEKPKRTRKPKAVPAQEQQ